MFNRKKKRIIALEKENLKLRDKVNDLVRKLDYSFRERYDQYVHITYLRRLTEQLSDAKAILKKCEDSLTNNLSDDILE